MGSKRLWPLVLVVAALALVATACGDDDDEGEDVAEDLLSDFDEEFTDLSDFSDLPDLSGDFTDFSDFSDFGGLTPVDCGDISADEDIEVGDTADGEIEESGDTAAFGLSGDGSTIDIAADQTDEQFDPLLTICDSDGTEVDGDDDSGGFPNALIEGFEAEDGEDYVVVVSGFSASTGEFELSVSE